MSEYIVVDGKLYHHGIKGMKWGVRRYQNPDGTLTDAGRKRQARRYEKELNRHDQKRVNAVSDFIRSDDKYDAALNKREERLAKYASDRDSKLEKMVTLDNETNKKIMDVSWEGYTVHSQDTIRLAKKGELFITARRVKGVKYKVLA